MWKKIEFKGKNKKKENSLKNEYEKESILEKGHKNNIHGRAISATIIGILLLIINFFVGIEGRRRGGTVENVVECISTAINSVVSIILGLGVGSLVLDFFSYIEYTQEKIKDVMITKDYLNTISNDEKRALIKKLQSSLYFKSENIPEDSLYTRIHDKILPLMDKEYLEKYSLHIDCSIQESKIVKNMYHELIIYSKHAKKFILPFAIYIKKSDTVEDSYIVNELEFNGEKQTYTCDKPDEDYEDGEVKRYSITYEFDLKQGLNSIKYQSNSVVDIKDEEYAHRVSIPTKHYSAEIAWDNDDYRIEGYGFALDNKSIISKNYNKMCKIEVDDWLLPGEGCIFTINKR